MLAVALIVSCTPVVVRGETATCAARLEPPGPLVVTELRADADGNVLRDPAEKHASVELLWRGLAVVGTRVTVTAHAPGGQPLTGSASFRVRPRAFPPLRLADTAPDWTYGEDRIFGGWPPRISLSSSPADPITADGALGQFNVTLRSPRTRYVEDGPNARWFYVAEPVPQPSYGVLVARALRPGDAFWRAQSGGPVVGLRPGCTRNDLDALREGILRHEGALPSDRPSHFSETRRTFEERDLQAEVEEMRVFYDRAVAGDPLQKLIDRKLQSFLDALQIDQRETVDAAAPVRLPCRLHYP